MIAAHNGVSAGVLSTTVLPVLIAWLALLIAKTKGAFQVVIAAHTPYGSHRTRRLDRIPRISKGGKSVSHSNLVIRSFTNVMSSMGTSADGPSTLAGVPASAWIVRADLLDPLGETFLRVRSCSAA